MCIWTVLVCLMLWSMNLMSIHSISAIQLSSKEIVMNIIVTFERRLVMLHTMLITAINAIT